MPLITNPVRDMKFFITRGTVLSVYREALKMCYQVKSDVAMRDSLVEMMKDEFRPFHEARDAGGYLTQE